MENIAKNLGYFFKETKTIIKLNLLSNVFSTLSMGFIFFMLSMVVSGVWISNQMIELIGEEVEINVFYNENIEKAEVLNILSEIEAIDGVKQVSFIDKEEAYERMEKIMGKDSNILEFFDHNPFSAFIEVKIDLDKMESIIEQIEKIDYVEHIRDNESVLNRLRNISSIIKVLEILIVSAIGVSTLVITSHIIRQGIYNNKEQINTLRLLGAPESFIAFPFFIEGFLLTGAAGIFASIIGALGLKYIYIQAKGPLPFIPLPPLDSLIKGNVIMILTISIVLGIIGSTFGLVSANKN